MRQFTHIDPITTTYHFSGQTIPFVNGVCELDDPSQIQLDWFDKMIKNGWIVETTPDKKKIKPSKRAAKKKRG